MENLCEYKILDDDLASPKYFGKNRGTIYTNLCAFWWFLFLFYNYGYVCVCVCVTYIATCCIKQLGRTASL